MKFNQVYFQCHNFLIPYEEALQIHVLCLSQMQLTQLGRKQLSSAWFYIRVRTHGNLALTLYLLWVFPKFQAIVLVTIQVSVTCWCAN